MIYFLTESMMPSAHSEKAEIIKYKTNNCYAY